MGIYPLRAYLDELHEECVQTELLKHACREINLQSVCACLLVALVL